MLDIQKERVFHNRPEIEFAQKSVNVLVGLAWIAPALLLFNKMYFWSILMILWFLLLVAAMPSFKKGQNWARVFLGSLSLIGAAGIVPMTLYGRTLLEVGTGLLPGDGSLPKWAGLWGAIIFTLGVTLLMSRRIKKALSLWSSFK